MGYAIGTVPVVTRDPKSPPTHVRVKVFIEDAAAWDPWLITELGFQAEKCDLGYDGGEEEGKFEVFDFTGDPEQVERAVVTVLTERGIKRPVTRKGNKVTVEAKPGRWLIPLAPQETAYEKALRRVVREIERQRELLDWVAGTGLRKIEFHEAHGPGQPAVFPEWQEDDELLLYHFTDLTIVDENPTKAQAEKVAREHIDSVLRAVAEYLRHPLP